MSIPVTRLTRYFLLSVIISTASFLLIRILNNQILCQFLRFRDICHIPNLLSVEYCNGRAANWTEGSLLLIHTTPYLLFLFGGIYIPHYFKVRNRLFRLTITWICLHMVLLFTGGLISGLFEYKGLGIPLTWFFINNTLRITGVVILIILTGYSIRRFGWYFLACVPNQGYLQNTDSMKTWLIGSLLIPLFISGIVISSLSDLDLLLNHAMSFITGLLYLPVITATVPSVYQDVV